MMEKYLRLLVIVLLQVPIIYLIFWLFIQPYATTKGSDDNIATMITGFVIIAVVTLPINIFSIVSIHLYSNLKTLRNFVLLLLLVTDISMLFVSIPLYIYIEVGLQTITSIKQLMICLKVEIFFDSFINIQYTSLIAVIMAYRIVKVCKRDSKESSKRSATIPVTLVFIYAITMPTIYIICFNRKWVTLYDVTVEFIIPTIIYAVSLIILTALKQNQGRIGNRNSNNSTDIIETELSGNNNQPTFTVQVDRRHDLEGSYYGAPEPANTRVRSRGIDKILYVLVISFIFLRGPYFIVIILRKSSPSDNKYVLRKLLDISRHMYYFKCCINPVLYFIFDEQLRIALLRGWSAGKRKFERMKGKKLLKKLTLKPALDNTNITHHDATGDELRLIQ